jgi:hypothetical protein
MGKVSKYSTVACGSGRSTLFRLWSHSYLHSVFDLLDLHGHKRVKEGPRVRLSLLGSFQKLFESLEIGAILNLLHYPSPLANGPPRARGSYASMVEVTGSK